MVIGTKRDLREYRVVSEDEGHVIANELGGIYYEISSADGYEDIEKLFCDSVKSQLELKFVDTERPQSRGTGLRKLKEDLLVRTKSLYRKRGMTF